MSKLTLDKKALADELSISIRTLERMMKDDLIPKPSDKFGKIIWPRAVIEAWLLDKPIAGEVAKVEKKRGRKRLAA